jgi:hypothetical protein
VHVDALDGAAALPRVVHRAVDDVLDRGDQIAVGGDVRRVVAAELVADVEEPALRGLRDAVTSEDRAGEDDVIDARVADRGLGRRVVAVERLDEPVGGVRGDERAREVLAAEGAPR